LSFVSKCLSGQTSDNEPQALRKGEWNTCREKEREIKGKKQQKELRKAGTKISRRRNITVRDSQTH
jgi:hypothetical protein